MKITPSVAYIVRENVCDGIMTKSIMGRRVALTMDDFFVRDFDTVDDGMFAAFTVIL